MSSEPSNDHADPSPSVASLSLLDSGAAPNGGDDDDSGSADVVLSSKREWTPEELLARAASQREEDELLAQESASLRASQKEWAARIQARRVGFAPSEVAADHPRDLASDYSQHQRRMLKVVFVEGQGGRLMAPLALAWLNHHSALVLQGHAAAVSTPAEPSAADSSAAAVATAIAASNPLLLRALDGTGVSAVVTRAQPLRQLALDSFDFLVTLDEESRTAVDAATKDAELVKCKRIHQPFVRPAVAAAAESDDVEAQWTAFQPIARQLEQFVQELPELISFM